mgnify:CR=1 FL=1|jgi:hypothetical protein|tara:strand:- start:51 stop:296 length:246 start_codon:yes stop_codon:yes gene_type:complete
MAEKQLTPEELQKVKNLQQQVQMATLQLGSIEVKKLQLTKEIESLQEQENQIAKNLSSKYGNGNLDLETGKITLVENVVES